MKYSFDKRKIESICTFLSFSLMLILLVLWVLYRADEYFNWDILPYFIQSFIENFLIMSIVGIVLFTITMSVILNISIASEKIENYVDQKNNEIQRNKIEFEIDNKTKKKLIGLVVGLILILVSLNLRDKWVTSNRMNYIIDTYITTKNLHELDSIVELINYNDSLQFQFNQEFNNKPYLNQDSYTLGISNSDIFSLLKLKYSHSTDTINDYKVGAISDRDLLLFFNNKWVLVSEYDVNLLKTNSQYDIETPIVKDIVKYLFSNNMDNVKSFNKEGYEVYYKERSSRSFSILIKLKSKHNCILNLRYEFWNQ